MARIKISQRRARNYRKQAEDRARQLNDIRQKAALAQVLGQHIATTAVNTNDWHIVNTARLLKHAVVAVVVSDKWEIKLYAVKL